MVSAAMRNRGFQIVVIGIGTAVDVVELFKLVSTYKDIFLVADLSHHETLVLVTRNMLLGPSKLIIIFLYF